MQTGALLALGAGAALLLLNKRQDSASSYVGYPNSYYGQSQPNKIPRRRNHGNAPVDYQPQGTVDYQPQGAVENHTGTTRIRRTRIPTGSQQTNQGGGYRGLRKPSGSGYVSIPGGLPPAHSKWKGDAEQFSPAPSDLPENNQPTDEFPTPDYSVQKIIGPNGGYYDALGLYHDASGQIENKITKVYGPEGGYYDANDVYHPAPSKAQSDYSQYYQAPPASNWQKITGPYGGYYDQSGQYHSAWSNEDIWYSMNPGVSYAQAQADYANLYSSPPPAALSNEDIWYIMNPDSTYEPPSYFYQAPPQQSYQTYTPPSQYYKYVEGYGNLTPAEYAAWYAAWYYNTFEAPGYYAAYNPYENMGGHTDLWYMAYDNTNAFWGLGTRIFG